MKLCLVNAIAPPAAGSRSERTLHLAAALEARGHAVTVLRARLPAGYPTRDDGLDEELARSRVAAVTLDAGRAPSWRYPLRGTRAGKLCRRVAAEAVWPDVWAAFARRASAWIDANRAAIDVVLTSGQPFSDHLAGYESARVSGLPWIADYGDPWGLVLRSGSWNRKGGFHAERRFLRLASGIVVTTEPTRRLFENRYGLPSDAIAVIPAGVPWAALGPPPSLDPPTILQVGTVYGARASAVPFTRALEALRRSGRPTRLVWYGELWRARDEEHVRQVADEYVRRASADLVSRAERKAHVLLILGNHGGVQVPAKVWRALGTGRILLVIEADERDPLRSLPELRGRAVFASNDVASITKAILESTQRIGRHPWAIPSRPADLPGWESRADLLERFLETWVARPGPRRRGLPARAWMRVHTALGTRLVAALLGAAHRRSSSSSRFASTVNLHAQLGNWNLQ